MTDLAQDLEEMLGPQPRLALVPAAPPPVHPAVAQFERCKAWLEPAMEGGRRTMADVERALQEGKAQLWPGKACAMVTEVHSFPTHRAIQVWLAGGDLAELMAMEAGLQAWARLQGCTEVLIEGRRGFERALKSAGYELWSVCLRKAL
jgi:hypothetical protein